MSGGADVLLLRDFAPLGQNCAYTRLSMENKRIYRGRVFDIPMSVRFLRLRALMEGGVRCDPPGMRASWHGVGIGHGGYMRAHTPESRR